MHRQTTTCRSSGPLPAWGVLQRKCACGGSAGLSGDCEACGKKRMLGVQTKLAISEPGDQYEREADRIADRVMSAPARSRVGEAPLSMQRFSKQSPGPLGEVPGSVGQALASSGRPLEPVLRQDMEERFGYDFSRVRIHTDVAAEQSARDVNAHAYTVGHDIVFGSGRFAPETHKGRRVIAHELTHVVQQSGSPAGLLQRSPDEGKKPEEKPKGTFAGCDADQEKTIVEAIAQVEGLAAMAVQALERYYSRPHEVTAMRDHFGSLGNDQKATIVERYKDIQASVAGKPYTCAKKGKKVKAGKAIVDLCGEAECPGSKITLFPGFGTATCPAAPVLLHEVAHNAGACDDIDKGKGYPPARAEDNAYSYEYFALAAAAGLKTPELGKRKPQVPKIKD